MSVSKALLLLCCVLGLSACGSSKSTQPAATQQAKAAPAIEAIDEPAPDAGWKPPPDNSSTASTYMCLGSESKADRKNECTPTPDQVQKLRQMEQMFEQAVQPAKVVAEAEYPRGHAFPGARARTSA